MDKELISLDGQFEDLREIRKRKYEASLRNLITGTTPKEDFPDNVIPQRPARGGASVDYVPGWWFIEQLNALFGHLWDFEVLRENIGSKQIWVLGRLTVRSLDGLTVTKTAFGGSDIKFKKETSEVIDIGDDLKAAATDSMKKAATLFGIAADIYGRRETTEQASPLKGQLAALYKIGKSKGMDEAQVGDFCMKKHGRLPNELEAILVLGLIQELRSK